MYQLEADFYTMADGWLIAAPDDPEMRQYLIEEEFMDPEFADLVLAKMRELAVSLGFGEAENRRSFADTIRRESDGRRRKVSHSGSLAPEWSAYATGSPGSGRTATASRSSCPQRTSSFTSLVAKIEGTTFRGRIFVSGQHERRLGHNRSSYR